MKLTEELVAWALDHGLHGQEEKQLAILRELGQRIIDLELLPRTCFSCGGRGCPGCNNTGLSEFRSPVSDPENIDPDGEALKDLVSLDDVKIGYVCGVYELCGHPFCEASYGAWVELDRARRFFDAE